MICLRIGNTKIEIHFLFVAIIALFTLVDQTQIALLGLVASLLHESGHIFAFVLLGFKIEKLSFELSGIALKKELCCMNFLQEIIVTMAGCTTNAVIFLSGLAFCGWDLNQIGVFSAINLIVCGINLLPMPTLDGGQAIRLIFGKTCSVNITEKICFIMQIATIVFFLGISVTTICLGKINFSFLILTVYLIFMVLSS